MQGAHKRQMPCGVSRSTMFLLPETQTKLKLNKIINPPGTWRQPLAGIQKNSTK